MKRSWQVDVSRKRQYRTYLVDVRHSDSSYEEVDQLLDLSDGYLQRVGTSGQILSKFDLL